jgi:hypothetical protein
MCTTNNLYQLRWFMHTFKVQRAFMIQLWMLEWWILQTNTWGGVLCMGRLWAGRREHRAARHPENKNGKMRSKHVKLTQIKVHNVPLGNCKSAQKWHTCQSDMCVWTCNEYTKISRIIGITADRRQGEIGITGDRGDYMIRPTPKDGSMTLGAYRTSLT